ncbi:MAG: hypothetical protein ACTSR4_06640 [Candidatus Hodarchaeales archaeon]
MKTERVIQNAYIMTAGGAFLTMILYGLAIHFYPGGSFKDVNKPGFDFYYNTVSDLGRLEAVNGESNLLSRNLYCSGSIILAMALVVLYSTIWQYFQERKATKWISIIGTIFGEVQAVLYISIAFTPLDINTGLHNRLIYSAPAFLYTTALLYMIAYFMKKDFPKINAYSFLALLISGILLTITVAIGSIVGEPVFTLSRRAGHTIFIFIVTAIYGVQLIGAAIYLNRRRKEQWQEEPVADSSQIGIS